MSIQANDDTQATVGPSGKEVAKRVKRGLPRTHADYWKARLFRSSYTRDGQRFEVNEWSARVQHLGIRRTVSLHTSNRDEASTKARDFYVAVIGRGWDAALAQFNPDMIVRKDDPTLAEFFADVEARSDLKPKTFRNYSGYFRRIVADLYSISSPGGGKFNYRTGQTKRWRDVVDAVRLGAITSDKLNDWRSKYIRAAGSIPTARASAVRSANSYIRCARALFSRKWIQRLTVRLPAPLPFAGVKVEKTKPPRYKSTIDPRLLLASAERELSASDPPAYAAFLLAIGAGLRKSEIDGLEWRHVNLERYVIHVEPTEHRDVKTESSNAEVEIDQALAGQFQKLKGLGTSTFVVECPERPKSKCSKAAVLRLDRQHYRAEPVFERLYVWLRSKGISTRCPLHTLRKEFGSMINQHFGLFAAMTALRHSNIETTSSYYTDNKQRIALPLGEMMGLAKPTVLPAPIVATR
jgi:integrase